jgi:hypothetical protein
MRPWAGTPVRTADGLIRLGRRIEKAEESLDVDPTRHTGHFLARIAPSRSKSLTVGVAPGEV